MTLIVEDGSVVANANSYVSLAYFKAYCDSRGMNYSAFTDTQIEQAAIRTWDYLLAKYRGTWKGYRKDATQFGDWPRSFVWMEPFVQGQSVGTYPFLIDDTTIPLEIKGAQSELMFKSLGEIDLMPDIDRLEQSVTVGPISVNFGAGGSATIKFELVDNMLRQYQTNSVTQSGGTRRVMRA